jgi:hypothetical protein
MPTKPCPPPTSARPSPALAGPTPSSSIEITISLGSYETVTLACALPACLIAFVSASCTTR